MRRVVRLAGLLFIGYASICALAFFFQRRLTYFPDKSSPPLPGGPGYAGLEEFETRTEDGLRIEGWYWPGDLPGTVVLFHGNAGNRGGRAEWMRALRSELKIGLCIVDYRGYGGSEGSPTEEGLYLDADATLAWLEAREAGPFVYLGQSLGSGVAVEMALRHPPAGLVLQTPFRSVHSIGASAYPWLPVKFLMRDRFDNEAKIGRLGCPLLIIAGAQDSLTPPEHARALHAAAPGPKDLVVIDGAGHDDLVTRGGADYFSALGAFLTSTLPTSR